MKTKLIELKPCPFCGGDTYLSEFYPYDGYQGESPSYSVEHQNRQGCMATMKSHDRIKVVEAWNTRVTSKIDLVLNVDAEAVAKFIEKKLSSDLLKAAGSKNESL